MARKRNPITEAAAAAAAAVAAAHHQDQIIIDSEDEEAAEVTEDVLEGLRRLEQGENRVTWYVYSQTPGKTGNSEGYIEKLRSEQLDEQRFKNLYGPGEYRIVGRTKDGGYVKGSHKVVRISDIGATPGGLGGEAANDPMALFREMREAEDRARAARAESLRTTATILAAPVATIVAALIARRPAVDMPALITALRPQQSSLTEMTTALASLKQLDGGGHNNVDMALKLLERIQDLPQGGGPGEGGWLGIIRDVVREAAPTVRELVGQIGQQQPAPLVGPVASHAPPAQALPQAPHPAVAAPPPAPPPPPPAPAEANDMWKVVEPWLKRKAEDLHEEAAANMPVELTAEHLLTAAEKKFGMFITPTELHALLSRPDWWAHLTAFYPPLTPFQAWVADVRGVMLEMLQDALQGNRPRETEPDETNQRTQ